jgi:hypothetical protein
LRRNKKKKKYLIEDIVCGFIEKQGKRVEEFEALYVGRDKSDSLSVQRLR